MKNHQILWIPRVIKKNKSYQKAIEAAKGKGKEVKRPWIDIYNRFAKLRSFLKTKGVKWTYYSQIKWSMTVDGEVR